VSSLCALLVFSPVLLIVALLVRVKLGAPIIFSQERPGLNGKIFKIKKFRSMTNKRDENGNLLPDAQRLTRFGKTLRALSLDELPELWNILKGDMSVVGPRPLRVSYLPLYSAEQARRHDMRPGLTGYAQVNGRNAISWEEKFALDCWYIDNVSFWLDIKIIFKTVLKVFGRSGITAEGSVSTTPFTGTVEIYDLMEVSMERERKDLVIVGAGGFGREIMWLMSESSRLCEEYNILGFVDDGATHAQGDMINGNILLGTTQWLLSYDKEICAVLCIGTPRHRASIVEKLARNPNISFPTVICDGAHYSPHVKFGKGCIVYASAMLTVNIELGDFVVVGKKCCIAHDTVLDDFVTLSTNATVSGVHIKSGVEIGMGVRVFADKTMKVIGENAIIGAGAVVLSDIPPDCTAVGTPAKPIKFHAVV